MDLVLELGLAKGALILLDAAPLVYYVEGPAESGRKRVVGAFLDAARSGALRLAVSAIAWTELLAGPAAAGDAARADAYRRALADSSLVAVEPVDVAIAEEAARLMAGPRRSAGPTSIELADAIHVATARIIRADAVLTNDEAWRRAPLCPRVLLVDELAFEDF